VESNGGAGVRLWQEYWLKNLLMVLWELGVVADC